MTDDEKSKPIEGTGLIAAKCPTCGGILSKKKGGELHCEFCGSKFFLHESYAGKTREIRNYYDLAYAALESGDDADACRYFTKILELDSTEALAWYGKATAVLRSSAGSKDGIKEAIANFKRVLPNAAEEEEGQIRAAIQDGCFTFGYGFAEYVAKRSWIPSHVVDPRVVWTLINFADEVLPLTNDQMKELVNLLCAHAFFVWSLREKKVKYYTERIRTAEPGYLNPWEAEEAGRRNLPPPEPFNWRPWAVVALGVVLITALLLLCCMIMSLVDTDSPESTSPEGIVEVPAETGDVGTVAEEVPEPELDLMVVVDEGLPMRKRANSASPVIKNLEKGETYEVIGRREKGDWREVKTEDGSGWVQIKRGSDVYAVEVER